MKKIILALSTAFALTANAQVKIGSNPSSINNNAHLDIESTTGSRLIVTKDSSKVGIGTLTPAAKLDVAGKVKISDGTQGNGKLFVSNASGVGSWVTPASALSSVLSEPWYSTTTKTGATSNTENIYQLGNVGIGTSTPQSTLDVSPVSGSSSVVIGTRGTQSSDQASILFGSKYAGNNNFQSAGNLGWQFGVRGNSFSTTSVQNALHASYWNGTNWTEYMSWRNNGNVGIGTTTPTAKLEVNGSISTVLNAGIGSIRLSQGTANNSGYIEFFNSNSTTRAGYIGWANGSDLLYNAENGFRHTFSGAGIYVTGGTNYTINNYAFYSNTNYTSANAGVYTGVSNNTGPYGVYSNNRIATSELNIFSDARIKNIHGRSSTSQDLEVLNKIAITDYSMKDFMAYGNKSFKKVIAQEVEEVFPQAINYSSNFIPNIYQPATVSLHGEEIELTIAKDHDLKINDTLKIYFAGKEKQLIVTNIPSKTSFKVSKGDVSNATLNDVFVYGKHVNDFRAVDYEALTTLNISATQELYKKIKALESQVQKLNELEKDIQFIKASISNHLGK